MNTKEPIHSLCQCGHTKISLNTKPNIRFFCHCTICQALYQQPFSDFVVLWAGDVQLTTANDIQFKKHRRPPALQRGTCASCKQPVIGYLTLFPGIKLAFIPSKNFFDASQLPEPLGHLFSHRRAKEIKDTLPQYSGYFHSEWAVSAAVFSRLVLNKYA